MKKDRQQKILDIISDKEVGTQQELAAELAVRGIQATQSSVSRDIARLGLVKVNGHYTVPGPDAAAGGPILKIETAGDNLIVICTDVGQAQPAAVRIDDAEFPEIVGTVAGDDTILVAVKNVASQRLAIKRIMELFAAAALGESRARGRGPQPSVPAVPVP